MREITKIALSVSVATGLYGISFGALAIAAGLTLWQTVALSLLMYTGGSQFAFIGVLAGGSGPAAVGASTLLGARNAIYGMQVKTRIRLRGYQVPLAAQLTTDESAAVSSMGTHHSERSLGFWLTGAGVFLLWNVFTLIGALAGERLGDPAAWGLDGAAVAAFVGLLWPRLESKEPIALAVACAVVTIVAIPSLPAGIPILLAAGVAALWGGRG